MGERFIAIFAETQLEQYKWTEEATLRQKRERENRLIRSSRALGASPLGLPVVVAGTWLLVPISSSRHTQALGAALLAEEHAWLLEGCLGASTSATRPALCKWANTAFYVTLFEMRSFFCIQSVEIIQQ